MALIKTLLSLALTVIPLTTIADTPAAWQEAITTRISHESSTAKAVWESVLHDGIASNKGLGRDDRRIFTLIQKTVEDEISKSLHNGEIKNAVMIIHALQPATPLHIGSKPGGPTLNQLNISPKSKNIVWQRRKILLNYLNRGGTLISVYQQNSKAMKTPIFQEYLALAEKHKSLLDKPIKSVPDRYWGATYLIRQLDDSIHAFSISSKQADLIGSKVEDSPVKPWNIWFGPLLNTEVSKRVVQIESFLKSEGVDMYTYLGFDGQNQ